MTRLTWPTVGLIAVLGVIAIGLATVAHWESAEVLGLLGVLGGIGGGAAVVGNVVGRVEEVRAETTAQTTQLTAIERHVNGELDARIEAGAQRAAAAVLGELRQQGVIR